MRADYDKTADTIQIELEPVDGLDGDVVTVPGSRRSRRRPRQEASADRSGWYQRWGRGPSGGGGEVLWAGRRGLDRCRAGRALGPRSSRYGRCGTPLDPLTGSRASGRVLQPAPARYPSLSL